MTELVEKEERVEMAKNIFSMIIPISIEGLLQMVATTTIMAMIGRLDPLAINAVGIGSRITQLLWAVVRGLTVGMTVNVARNVGAKDQEGIKMVAVCGSGMLLILTTIFSTLIFMFANPLVNLFGGSEQTITNAVVYMKILCIGLPFWAVMLITTAILQGHGDAKTPMLVTVSYNLISALIGYLLIYGSFGFPRMEIRGAAWALVLGQIMMSLVSLYILYKKGIIRNIAAQVKSTLQDKIQSCREILDVGIPSALENALWQLGTIAMLKPIISYGEYAYATHQFAMQAESISYMPTNGFGIATTTFVGRFLGAEDHRRVNLYFKQIRKYLLSVAGIIAVFMAIFSRQLMSILTIDPDIINTGAIYLCMAAVTFIPQSLNAMYSGGMRAAGHSKQTTLIAIAGLWGVRVTLAYFFTYILGGQTIIWIWLAMSLDLVVRYLLSSTYIRKKQLFV